VGQQKFAQVRTNDVEVAAPAARHHSLHQATSYRVHVEIEAGEERRIGLGLGLAAKLSVLHGQASAPNVSDWMNDRELVAIRGWDAFNTEERLLNCRLIHASLRPGYGTNGECNEYIDSYCKELRPI
jgi:hypothetical protein